MGYTIKSDIVVPNGYVYNASNLRPGFHQVHMHSTGNPTASVQNERDYLAGHYNAANYTHLVGITNGAVDIRQVMNTNGGAWDVGGDWNWETYAAIEFSEGSIQSQADFNKAYPAYIWLARYLAKQAGITYTIDNLNTIGIKSHNYASATGHGSDHVDPIPFLAKWGVSRDKFNRDLVNGVGNDTIVAPVVTPTSNTNSSSTPATSSSAIQQFKNAGNHFTNTKTFKVDKIAKVNGIWQMINCALAGGTDADWTNNGIPLDIVDNVTRGMAPTQVGDVMKFSAGYDNGTIDKYDTATNGVGIVFVKYGIIWFNADAFIKL
ncbi:lytic exoenzyme target recognition domain-containing protein [Leuconostoc falkenbergense]|uniref:lytic exoenzyme target recognition domain-containing protein n=1 Tax=Leuconostoc falkenbergense TaxID=2766470 RepID=UPI0024AD55AD|nr:lytic exoenzyme target recognition domain-containing protein [Leuconostoc falkenbergense]MDI6667044.1 lytic exoenzyme target recognition domain-containing protein [Leuconostoc falkenbergense]